MNIRDRGMSKQNLTEDIRLSRPAEYKRTSDVDIVQCKFHHIHRSRSWLCEIKESQVKRNKADKPWFTTSGSSLII